ncbi:arabinogalactan protein 20 [Vigna unguiculata]|uniref:Arabinogalactan peptide n=1 Tax=Vigna unguiculata TaxID=3917 RepID=A0A4D6KM50_VIGUN|nr:arabinogalactan protein 20 [Vigna unguiculata]QCD77553.1 Arabinogalactan peptide [Vigna unguiculata]
MAFFRAASEVLAIYTFIFAIFSPPVLQAQTLSLAPAPAPSSDGTSIDQGIAYILMLVALVLTYLIHPFDAFSHQL